MEPGDIQLINDRDGALAHEFDDHDEPSRASASPAAAACADDSRPMAPEIADRGYGPGSARHGVPPFRAQGDLDRLSLRVVYTHLPEDFPHALAYCHSRPCGRRLRARDPHARRRLPEQAHPLPRSVSARRRQRRRGARSRAEDIDQHRAAGGRREPPRRDRHGGGRGARKVATRRLYDHDRPVVHRGEPVALRLGAFRRSPAHADHARGHARQPAARESEFPRAERRGRDPPRQGAAGQAQLRIDGQRRAAAHGDGAVQVHGRRRHRARAVQRRGAGHHGHRRGRGPDAVHQRLDRDAADQGGQASRAGHRRGQAQPAAAGRADDCRVRIARLREPGVARHLPPPKTPPRS